MKKTIGIIVLILFIGLGITSFYFIYKNAELERKANNSTKLVDINFADLEKKVADKDDFVLLIKQDGCGACTKYEPIIKAVLEEYNLTAYSLNLTYISKEEDSKLVDIASVSATPTTLFFKDGVEETTLNRIEGSATKKSVVKKFKDLGIIER